MGDFGGFAAWRHLWSSRSKRPPRQVSRAFPPLNPRCPACAHAAAAASQRRLDGLRASDHTSILGHRMWGRGLHVVEHSFGLYRKMFTCSLLDFLGVSGSMKSWKSRMLPETCPTRAKTGSHQARTSKVPRKQAVVLPLNLQAGLRSRFENTGALPLPHKEKLSTANMFLHCAAQRHPS